MSDVAAINAKIAELEAEMARTQKNKATNYHLGMSIGMCCDVYVYFASHINIILDNLYRYSQGQNCQTQIRIDQWTRRKVLGYQECRTWI